DSFELRDLGLINLPNPFYVAFAINAGYYLALFSAGGTRAPDPKARQSRTLPNKTRSMHRVPSNRCSRRLYRGTDDGRHHQPAHRHDRGDVGGRWHARLSVYVYAARPDAQDARYSGGARAHL